MLAALKNNERTTDENASWGEIESNRKRKKRTGKGKFLFWVFLTFSSSSSINTLYTHTRFLSCCLPAQAQVCKISQIKLKKVNCNFKTLVNNKKSLSVIDYSNPGDIDILNTSRICTVRMQVKFRLELPLFLHVHFQRLFTIEWII